VWLHWLDWVFILIQYLATYLLCGHLLLVIETGSTFSHNQEVCFSIMAANAKVSDLLHIPGNDKCADCEQSGKQSFAVSSECVIFGKYSLDPDHLDYILEWQGVAPPLPPGARGIHPWFICCNRLLVNNVLCSPGVLTVSWPGAIITPVWLIPSLHWRFCAYSTAFNHKLFVYIGFPVAKRV